MMPFENIQIQLIDTPPITPDYMDVFHHELVKMADGIMVIIDPLDTDPTAMLQALLDRLRGKSIEFIAADRELPPGRMFCKKTLMVANKSDLTGGNEDALQKFLTPDFKLIRVSAYTGEGLENLKEKIFAMLNIVRVHSKIPGKKAGLESPYTLKKGSTVMDMAREVHKDFSDKLRFARIWGKNKYQGQKVNRKYILEDEDIIELHI
jgi:ribosome-interacting GTPase 1